MTLGDFTAFNSYLALLIFPILVLGFTSNSIAQSAASYSRIREVLDVPHAKHTGKLVRSLAGRIDVKNVELAYDSKTILRNISFRVQPGTSTAIIGPTAA